MKETIMHRKTPSRRQFVKAAGALSAAAMAGLYGASAHAAQYKLRYANNLPANHPMNVQARQAAQEISSRTNGKVELQIFPNNQLGNDTNTLAQVRSGAVDFFTLSPLILGSLVPTAQVSGVGFAFADMDQVWRAMDGDLGAYVREEITRATQLVVFENIWDNGFRVTTTGRSPISKPEDMRGLKLRIPPGPLWVSMFGILGASPVTMNFAEVYSALQTHVVDGQENPLVLIHTAKLYEVQKHLALTNHMWDGFWFLANKRSFERLPEDLREIVRDCINQAALRQREGVAQLNKTARQELEAAGMQINEVDTQAFREHLRNGGFYQEWRKKLGDKAWTLLESYSGQLA
ncbi:TRAP transporter substrate-binding protein [Vandammella animalimorsus]|nr:TRAP transporter substrate-binding protein [Vandammella animalimorsus]